MATLLKFSNVTYIIQYYNTKQLFKGIMQYTRMSKGLIDVWNQTIDVNCKGMTNCIGHVLPGMVDRGHGHIVNMSSDLGRRV